MFNEMIYTVKQLAVMAGVSARTLHYYDEIGLLVPQRNPANGYRVYDRAALLRLQQILYLRELGMGLDDIQAALDRPDFDLLQALEEHRMALMARQERLSALITTVERTIAYTKGKIDMDGKELFEGFSDEQQKIYEEEARRRWGDHHVDESHQRWGSYSDEKKKQVLAEGQQIYQDMAAAMPLGPASAQAQSCVARWHANLRNFYEPTTEILLGLGDLYNDDPDFNATFNKIHPDLAEFMRQAIQIYCKGR
jgi:MerR family transcriptional regulator, thiopeptide resistance regulator